MTEGPENRMTDTKKNLRVKFFGSFVLADDQTVLDEEQFHSKKLIRLISYMIIHRDRTVAHQELMTMLWGMDSRNPAGALKNLVYRLRNELQIFGAEEFILTETRGYRWNPRIHVETDYDRLCRMAEQIRSGTASSKEMEEMCRAVLDKWSSRVSSYLEGQEWLVSESEKYRALYLDVMKGLCAFCESEREWELLEQLCGRILEVSYAEEDVHCQMLKSLFRQRKRELAMQHYEKANSFFISNAGIRLSGRMEAVLQEMIAGEERHADSMRQVMEKLLEEEIPEGAYFCSYPVFKHLYQVEARRLDRSGLAEYVLLLTLRQSGKLHLQSNVGQNVLDGMAILESVLRSSLRIGDVVCRNGVSQFIILLPMCTYESGIAVAGRIQKNFKKSSGKRHLEVVYELEEILSVDGEDG